MRASLKPFVLTAGLTGSDSEAMTRRTVGRYEVAHFRNLNFPEGVINLADAVVVHHQYFENSKESIDQIQKKIPVIVAGPTKIGPDIPHIRTPIHSDSFLGIFTKLLGSVKKVDVNWGPFKKGMPVTSRATPDWGIGVVIGVLADEFYLVLFPLAPGEFRKSPVSCHKSTLK